MSYQRVSMYTEHRTVSNRIQLKGLKARKITTCISIDLDLFIVCHRNFCQILGNCTCFMASLNSFLNVVQTVVQCDLPHFISYCLVCQSYILYYSSC